MVGHYKLGAPYRIKGRLYRPEYDPSYAKVGTASWYGSDFHGLPTANGEVFDKELITAAHPTLPLPSIVRVTNLENGRSIDVRVNDRGPFIGDRLIDLSQAAARKRLLDETPIAHVPGQGLQPSASCTRNTQAREGRDLVAPLEGLCHEALTDPPGSAGHQQPHGALVSSAISVLTRITLSPFVPLTVVGVGDYEK